MQQVWISALGLSLASVFGSLLGFFVKSLSHRWNDAIMGFCAGVMLAASTVGLILESVQTLDRGMWWMALAGVLLGALFLNLLDFVTPHMHVLTGLDQETHHHNAALSRIMLFVMAVALHKLPEGMAAGVGFNSEEVGNAWAVTWGIAIQNIPEGMVVVTPLLMAGVSRLRSLIIGLVIALLEIIGVWAGYGAGAISAHFLPLALAFAGGAMLYVVSDEMIPRTHSHGHERLATYMLLAGFMTLVFLDGMF